MTNGIDNDEWLKTIGAVTVGDDDPDLLGSDGLDPAEEPLSGGDDDYDVGELSKALDEAKIEHFTLESRGVLSKYFDEGESTSLFVIDRSNGRLTEISKYTSLYERFSRAVRLSRVYVRPDQSTLGREVIHRITGGGGSQDE